MKILLASPRGFCAGVDRAILIVEKALEKFGRPVYVRHEIVHNKAVVSKLREKGAIFVEELDEVPDNAVVIFSAHGVAASVYENAKSRELVSVDATCPLVKKVHFSVQRHAVKKRRVILIGHQGHPEVIGTMGQAGPEQVILVGSPKDVENLELDRNEELAYTTQTTLSMDETAETMAALKKKFKNIIGPEQGDLCYATTNRQKAVSNFIEKVDLLLVIGSSNSSNSTRLKEIGETYGKPSFLIDGPSDIEEDWFKGVASVGISSGASAPEELVQAVLAWIKEKFPGSETEEISILEEDVHFPLPKELMDDSRVGSNN